MAFSWCSWNGRFRWISKWFKKWGFAKGDKLTEYYSRLNAKKYLLKYLRKEAKLSVCKNMMGKKADHASSIRLATDMSDVLLSRYSDSRSEQEIRTVLVEAIVKSLGSGLTMNRMKVNEVQTLETLVSPIHFIRYKSESHAQAFVHRFADYALGLGEAIEKNRGLGHSKVREYWLERGPRMFVLAVLFFVYTLVCQELFHPFDEIDNASVRTNTFVVNTAALIIAILMLYWRLHDCIEASISRTSHDYYVDRKRKIDARDTVGRHLEGADNEAQQFEHELNGSRKVGRHLEDSAYDEGQLISEIYGKFNSSSNSGRSTAPTALKNVCDPDEELLKEDDNVSLQRANNQHIEDRSTTIISVVIDSQSLESPHNRQENCIGPAETVQCQRHAVSLSSQGLQGHVPLSIDV